MLSAKEIEAALDTGHELRGLEVKGPLPATDSRFFAKVARAALSMGNLRDGGHVVIGIADDELAAMLPGLAAANLATWLAFDDVSQRMSEYSDPPLRLHIAQVTLSTGAVVAVIEVEEFADIPHLCAEDYSGVLRRGALYVRSRKMPQTAEIASSSEMRALLDLATQKALRSFIETVDRAGVRLEAADAAPSEDVLFEQERKRGWGE